MNYNSTYPVFRLFIIKAKKLENSSFLESLISEFRLGFKLEVGKEIEVTSIRPEQESIDAFVLTFRFFIQDNETISIRNLKKIFDSNLVTKKEKEEYNLMRLELNKFLSESANIELMGDKPTNREIMDTVLFGELSHANKEKEERYQQWMSGMELSREFIWHKFIISIMHVVNVVQRIKCIFCSIISRNLATDASMVVINYGSIRYSYTNNSCCDHLP